VSIAFICKIYKRKRIPSSYKSYKWQRLTLDHGKGYSRPLISLTNDSDWHLIMVKDIIPFTLIKCQLLSFVRLIRGREYPSPWSSVNRVICKIYKRTRIPFTMIKWSRWRVFSSSYKSYKWQRLTLDHGKGYSLRLISLTNDSDWHLIKVKDILVLL
jgi:hypothetical protein